MNLNTNNVLTNLTNSLKNSFFILSTKVLDSETSEPLEFATVVLADQNGKPIKVNNNFISRKSDLDGKFNMPINAINAYLKITYVGYNTLIAPAENFKDENIYLTKSLHPATSKDVVIKSKRIYPKKKPTPSLEKRNWWKWILVGLGALGVTTIAILLIKNFKS